MRHHKVSLDVVQGQAGSGAATDCRDLTDKTVHVHGTFTATVAIEGRIDNTVNEWTALAATVTAPAFIQIPQTITEIRVTTSGWTSSPKVDLAGRETRTE
jgi:hypothetical protein